jgi:hypothetical protein
MRLVLDRTETMRSPAAAAAGRISRTCGGWFSKRPVRPIQGAQILHFFEDRPPGRVLDIAADARGWRAL